MSETAQLFIPDAHTLDQRVCNLRSVHTAYQQSKRSQKIHQDKAWSNRLGEPQEIQYANQVMEHSLSVAMNTVSRADIKQAEESNLLSRDEVVELLTAKRQLDMQASRKQDTYSQQHQNSSRQKR